MTVASIKHVKSKSPAKSGTPPAVKLQLLPIARMLPTSDNRRRPITQASVESLAKSVARDGVLQPVIVRPHPTRSGYWELRAGERRWRAARLAGLSQLPAIIRTLDDQAALSVTLAENMHRLDLHPLEEAATIQQAFARKYDPKAVAAQLGKSVQYIARRASLTRLSKRWQTAILQPDSDASRLSTAHLELIARLPVETQDLLSDRSFEIVFGRGFPSVDDLRRIINAGLHSLKAMPWRVDDDTLDPKAGSCVNCPKRSGKQPLLFDEAEPDGENVGSGRIAKGDRCLDPSCYDGKLAAHLMRCESTLRRAHPTLRLVQVTYERLSPATLKAFANRIVRTSQPLAVKAKGKINVPAMPVDGPKAGRLMFLPSEVTRDGSARNGTRGKNKRAKGAAVTPAERTARLQHGARRIWLSTWRAFSSRSRTKTSRRSRGDWRARTVPRISRRPPPWTSWRCCLPLARARARIGIRTPTRGRTTTGCARAPPRFARSRLCANSRQSGRDGSPASMVRPLLRRPRMPSACARCSAWMLRPSSARRCRRFPHPRAGRRTNDVLSSLHCSTATLYLRSRRQRVAVFLSADRGIYC
jgi:ParB/RepB/Spo0J family partition protein